MPTPWASDEPVCGDTTRLYLKVVAGRIAGVRFQTLGCAAAIALSSIATEMMRGRTLEEALREVTRAHHHRGARRPASSQSSLLRARL